MTTSRRRLVFDDNDSSGDEDDKKPATRTNDAADAATPDVQIVPPPSSPPKRAAKSKNKKRNKGQLDIIFDSPEAKRVRVVVPAVTPEQRAVEQLSKYVPKYVHKNVEYLHKGEAKLPPNTIKVYQWICRHFTIPQDFEQKRFYGPLSGINYEERVIRAYSLGKLERNNDGFSDTVICTVCAEEGHQRDDCPTLL